MSRKLEDGTLAETLGDEAQGMVVVDYDGHPQKYDAVEIMSQFVAKEVNVLKIDIPRAGGKGWKRAQSEIDTQDADLGDAWCEAVSSGAKYVLEETWVKANDPHYDAKVWPIAHPYGTGSELSELGSGSPQAHARNRAMSIQSLFRRTARWAFWKLDCLIKKLLFNANFSRRKRGRPGPAVNEPDAMKRHFGTTVPTSIPESTSWWAHQQKDLFALTEASELGMMEAMVTITHNDFAPEMLASARRGPFAEPTPSERIEYLVTRLRSDRTHLDHENYALEHVLSYQRRIAATKDAFMKRNTRTPLGILKDWWDRTML